MNNPKPTQLYDVAVLGSSLPGLVAAALLAQRGLRVLHVAPAAAGTWESGGYRLPVAPQLLPSPKLLPAVRETLDELTLSAFVNRALQTIPAQILLPRARLELGSERDLVRAFGAGGELIAATLGRLAATVEATAPAVTGASLLPRTFRERLHLWTHARSKGAHFRAPLDLDGAGSIEEALVALHRFTTSDGARPGGLAFARATAPLLHGFHRLPEGGIAAHLVGHVRARRGDALIAKVDEIELEQGRFSGLQIRGELWRARSLLAALPTGELAALLPEGRGARRVQALGARITAEPMQIRSLVIAKEGLPPGLGPLALATGFEGTTALIQTTPAAKTDGKDDPTVRVLTVVALGDEARLNALLEEVLPFHQGHVRHRATPPEQLASYSFAGARKLGFEGLPVRIPVPGVVLAGPEILPGLGLEGAFLAGRAVATAAQAITSKR